MSEHLFIVLSSLAFASLFTLLTIDFIFESKWRSDKSSARHKARQERGHQANG